MISFPNSASFRTLRLAAVLLSGVLAVPAIRAQVVFAPAAPVIGSSNTVSADPRISAPTKTSCNVRLFNGLEFADFNPKSFTYTPPAKCPGPWAKVVFSADFTVTKGLQYDRTAQFFLGGAMLYFGTTPEPRSNLSPDWHVESDVTDLSSLLKSTQTGSAILGNFVGIYNGQDYNGLIYANANLTFYATDSEAVAPPTPSLVIGLPGNGGAATLNTSSSLYKQIVKLPTNVVAAYLDVFAQGQSSDEFWYFNVPNDLTTLLDNYGNTAFRETEIAIDGIPAGVAPVYPWVFTGGVDPFLWEPIPGVQTLNFKPFRVDLTPFAGYLSDGKNHLVTLQVYNADSYFQIAGNLLIYTDPVLTKVSGKLVTNTLASEPTVDVVDNLNSDGQGDVYGWLKVSSGRSYKITGEFGTSNGWQAVTVEQNVKFANTQYYTINPSGYIENVNQLTTYDGGTYTTAGGITSFAEAKYSYPFVMNYSSLNNPDGTFSQITSVDQQYWFSSALTADGEMQYAENISNAVTAQDTLHFDSGGNFTGNTGAKSEQKYVSSDSNGHCYSGTLTSANVKLTTAVFSTTCGN
jgi:hypothetical protein